MCTGVSVSVCCVHVTLCLWCVLACPSLCAVSSCDFVFVMCADLTLCLWSAICCVFKWLCVCDVCWRICSSLLCLHVTLSLWCVLKCLFPCVVSSCDFVSLWCVLAWLSQALCGGYVSLICVGATVSLCDQLWRDCLFVVVVFGVLLLFALSSSRETLETNPLSEASFGLANRIFFSSCNLQKLLRYFHVRWSSVVDVFFFSTQSSCTPLFSLISLFFLQHTRMKLRYH